MYSLYYAPANRELDVMGAAALRGNKSRIILADDDIRAQCSLPYARPLCYYYYYLSYIAAHNPYWRNNCLSRLRSAQRIHRSRKCVARDLTRYAIRVYIYSYL